jgi:hypothetical protein
VAIASLVELAQQRVGLTSIAGLWQPSILPHLWETSPRQSSRSQDYRAPTLSWVSVDTPVYHCYYGPDTKSDTKQVDRRSFLNRITTCAIEPPDQTRPYAQVKGGSYLAIRGPLKKVRITKFDYEYGGHSWTNTLASYPFNNNKGQPTHFIFRPDTKEVAKTDILELYCLVIVNVLAAAGSELNQTMAVTNGTPPPAR